MNIHHQIYPQLGSDNLYMVERPLAQVERFDKLPLVTRKISLTALALGNFDRLLCINNLDDV